jgi:hypothetical protein
MTQPFPVDWNTWDVRYHTAVAHLPSGLLSWGNLLAYLAMQQLAAARPGGWRFAVTTRVPVCDGVVAVTVPADAERVALVITAAAGRSS